MPSPVARQVCSAATETVISYGLLHAMDRMVDYLAYKIARHIVMLENNPGLVNTELSVRDFLMQPSEVNSVQL